MSFTVQEKTGVPGDLAAAGNWIVEGGQTSSADAFLGAYLALLDQLEAGFVTYRQLELAGSSRPRIPVAKLRTPFNYWIVL